MTIPIHRSQTPISERFKNWTQVWGDDCAESDFGGCRRIIQWMRIGVRCGGNFLGKVIFLVESVASRLIALMARLFENREIYCDRLKAFGKKSVRVVLGCAAMFYLCLVLVVWGCAPWFFLYFLSSGRENSLNRIFEPRRQRGPLLLEPPREQERVESPVSESSESSEGESSEISDGEEEDVDSEIFFGRVNDRTFVARTNRLPTGETQLLGIDFVELLDGEDRLIEGGRFYWDVNRETFVYQNHLKTLIQRAKQEIYTNLDLWHLLDLDSENLGKDRIDAFDAGVFIPLASYAVYLELHQPLLCPLVERERLSHLEKAQTLFRGSHFTEARKKELVRSILKGVEASDEQVQALYIQIVALATPLYQGPLMERTYREGVAMPVRENLFQQAMMEELN